jgi:hypothetical protein
MPLFLLIHSPSVGPSTWTPVAQRLREAGCAVAVPSLLAVGEGDPPFWPRVVAAVAEGLARTADGLAGTDSGQQLVLVGHSNAGVFMPVIAHNLAGRVACSIFADATVPASRGLTPVAEEEFLPFLRGLAGPDGRLPRWTDWWDEDDVAPLFPDPQSRQVITDEQPRLPLAYYLEQVPVPAGWDDHRCAYLQFSEPYQDQAARARQRGWPVQLVPGGHLHQIVDPDRVARALLGLAAAAGSG